MFQVLIKWPLKLFIQLIFWVFILSLDWHGQTLYERVHKLLYSSELAQLARSEVNSLWHWLTDAAEGSYAKLRARRVTKQNS